LNSISIIIPAHNEASRLESTLDSYVSYFSHLGDENFEIIVVCNGCQDSTPLIAAEFTPACQQPAENRDKSLARPNIRCFRNHCYIRQLASFTQGPIIKF